MNDWEALAQGAMNAVQLARMEVLAVMQRSYVVEYKKDHSPVTDADVASQTILLEKLQSIEPSAPVVSEELADTAYDQRLNWTRLWMVDPLDGTKEFVRGNGEFTINVALIENHQPVVGIIDWPVGNVTYMAIRGQGAYRIQEGKATRLFGKQFSPTVKVVISRSHRESEVQWVRQCLLDIESVDYVGSALKFCRIAEGRNDIYPRLTPNMEWDSAAGHILVAEAGGQVVDFHGQPLHYNKPDLHNNGFVAVGDWEAWSRYFASQAAFTD
ncbi:MAG: 3'(2'),5'-bisphosphate nucleotidase CysQ [Firmicutes bacterium]|jgi:3'(2'), 5'-bisphosphate nucleotidase|uniref:3'(2'),5'-bisphosphate nucleotidase CysQ n=1 Tax=Sulfobacillus benefaciens TaxID=453960 RepID=A0A2T2XBE4_9FIRM|nr:3'(2'),5'-bisphosphate nucleotidase CysQ [Bacillota bacterium]MCL5012444.1 3'(2'),5'-bisphosphate nucleotidase CysQ [Bacillota bacterium]PSR31824.1 MAG: 3'(2'),5'-bisphosphate nucleotidase [Sulfobacillus benefaciens]